MNKALCIGSVFQVEKTKLMVVGYTVEKNGEKLLPGYKCLALPFGFVDDDKVLFVSYNYDKDVVFTPETDEDVDGLLSELYKLAASIDAMGDSALTVIETINRNVEELIEKSEAQ